LIGGVLVRVEADPQRMVIQRDFVPFARSAAICNGHSFSIICLEYDLFLVLSLNLARNHEVL